MASGKDKAGQSKTGMGKANAPGQQTAASTRPAPGKSGETGRGHSPENRALRDQERAAERAAEQAAEQDSTGAESGTSEGGDGTGGTGTGPSTDETESGNKLPGGDPTQADPNSGEVSLMQDRLATNAYATNPKLGRGGDARMAYARGQRGKVKSDSEDETSESVMMTKSGATMEVEAADVEAHKRMGWGIVQSGE